MSQISTLFNEQDVEASTNGLVVSPTVLQVDRWGRRKGAELYDQAVGGPTEDLTREEWADIHAACFEPRPRFAENPSDTERAQWFDDLMSTDDYRALHKRTRGNLGLSKVAAHEIAEQYAKWLDLSDETKTDAIACAGSVSRATRRSRQAVDEAVDAMEGLGGLGAGGSGATGHTEADADRIAGVFERVRTDSTLRLILNSAGRFRRLARSLQRAKTVHGMDDRVGITLGNNVKHLVQSELLNLCDPDLEWLTLHRIATSRAIVKEYQGVEPQGKGPIVVVVDESGSMRCNNRHETAKGLALTLAWVANQQQRWIAFVGFSGGTQGNTLAMPPSKWDQEKLIEWLLHFYGGGTSTDVPIRELPSVYWPEWIQQGLPRGKTDVVTISDGIIHVSDVEATTYRAWKRSESVRQIGISVGCDAGESFESLCDQYFTVGDVNVDEGAIREALSI